MSDKWELVDRLLDAADAAAREQILGAYRDRLGVECIEELKARSDALLLETPSQALEIAEIALQVASILRLPASDALSRWARGNALVYLGRYEGALDDYQHACALYKELATDPLAVARLQSNMVTVLKNLGRYDEALAMAETARKSLEPWGQSRYLVGLELNVGSIYRLLGRYEEALSAYDRGRALFAAWEDRVQVARVDINRARVLVCMDQFRQAEALLHDARRVLAEESKALPAARAELNLATLMSRQGRHREALEMYARAKSGFDALAAKVDAAVVDLYSTYDHLALNLLPEAVELATEALDVLAKEEMPRYVALAMGNQATAARKLGRYKEAMELLGSAHGTFEKLGSGVEAAMVKLEQAACLRAMGQPEQGMALAREVVAAFDAHHCVLQAARARLVLADCLLDTGEVDKAASLYRSDLETLHDIPSLAWQAHAGLGRMAASRGEERAAYDHLVAAIHNIETAVERLGLDELQAGFMSDKIDVYKQAVQLALRLGERDGAFGHVERSKSGVWRDFLSQGQAETGDQDEIQALRQQWHWLYTRLTRPDEEGDLRGSETQARWAELRALERQIAQARRETLQHLEIRPRLTPADVQQHVPPDVLLVDYYCTTSQVIAFVIARDDIRVCEPIASLATVARLVNRWQFHLSSIRRLPASQLLDEALEILHDLYGLLVSPLEPYIGTRSTLWVVPHDLIWAIPFAALHDGSQYLVDRLTIAYVPGLILPGKSAGDVASVMDHPLVVGYSEGRRLVHAIREAERVSQTLANAETLLESEATMDQVRTAASTCSLLHLATHGVFRTDAPLFSSIHLADGWLTAGDLEGWSMPRAELVTLSACETGVSLRRGGDLLGLARSLFRAGARRVVASQWAAHDASTAALMPRFYRQLGNGERASEALRGAQIATRDEHIHPFYWAGFQTMQLL